MGQAAGRKSDRKRLGREARVHSHTEAELQVTTGNDHYVRLRKNTSRSYYSRDRIRMSNA